MAEFLDGDASNSKHPLFGKFRMPPDVSDFRFSNALPPPPIGNPGPERPRLTQEPLLTEQEVVKACTSALSLSEEFWESSFREFNLRYVHPTLVIYHDDARETSPTITRATGPVHRRHHHHPFVAGRIFIDPGTYSDFYHSTWSDIDSYSLYFVVFHEVAHEVQHQLHIVRHWLGTENSRSTPQHILDIALELQADYLAGAAIRCINEKKEILEEGDAKKGYEFVSSLGDDFVSMRLGRYTATSELTHGFGADRARAYWAGITTGDWRKGLDLDYFIRIAKGEVSFDAPHTEISGG